MKFMKETFLTVSLVLNCKEVSKYPLISKERERITPFDTVAIDPNNIKLVFLEVKDKIFKEKLDDVV